MMLIYYFVVILVYHLPRTLSFPVIHIFIRQAKYRVDHLNILLTPWSTGGYL